MTESLHTRCPQCGTVFRVTPAQLAQRGGRVRCGRCRTAFDAGSSLQPAFDAGGSLQPAAVEGVRPADLGERLAHSEPAEPKPGLAAPEIDDEWDPLSASARASVRRDAPAFASAYADGQLRDEHPAGTGGAGLRDDSGDSAVHSAEATDAGAPSAAALLALASAGVPASDADGGEFAAIVAAPAVDRAAPLPPPAGPVSPPSWSEPARASRRWTRGLLALALALALVAQATYQSRDILAARFPWSKPVLVEACEWIGCRVEPPRAKDRISIEASELESDAAHRGLLILSATLRNRAEFAVAYPHLELTLTDLEDQVVARRVFAPAEYAGGTTRLDAGVQANAEVTAKLFIDASATRQQGYRLRLFYP